MFQANAENESLVRVKTTIVGGGLNLQEGQVVSVEQLGEYCEALYREGAIEPLVPPKDNRFKLL